MNSFGIFETYYSSHQLADKTPSDIAWIGSFQIYCMFSGGLFAGRIFDSHGPRWLLLCGSCLFIVCFFIIPECKEYYQFFLAQGVAFGISISMMFTSLLFSANVDSFHPLPVSVIGSDGNELSPWESCTLGPP